MARWIVFVLAGWWLLLYAVAARADTSEAELLQGDWILSSLERDGEPLPFAEKGDRFTLGERRITIDTKAASAERDWEYRLNAGTEPKQFDLLPVRRNRTKDRFTLRGIYKLDGERLTICIADPPGLLSRDKESTRPKDFVPGGTQTLLTFERTSAPKN